MYIQKLSVSHHLCCRLPGPTHLIFYFHNFLPGLLASVITQLEFVHSIPARVVLSIDNYRNDRNPGSSNYLKDSDILHSET